MKDEELLRYSRQIMLPEIEVGGQERLLNSRVLIVGLGGLGCPVAMYLAAAGVGQLVLADFDQVDLSNLQRQILHYTADVSKLKVDSAIETIQAMNPDVNVIRHAFRLDESNVMDIFNDYDVIVDGTDNFATRYLVNDAAVLAKKPLVHGSIFQFEGQLTVFDTNQGPCYRCLFPSPPPPGLVPG